MKYEMLNRHAKKMHTKTVSRAENDFTYNILLPDFLILIAGAILVFASLSAIFS